eukprot:TRINITY_DN2180_c0_g2_i1.p2 TRINITY_DN2180_c0_g2~~TRINITY_DN2180_c0_g2_i1.p2  ORF type:complete len:54 (-),score=0.70 TRINITY_DN2180_c0_g2_i1:32-193(-)
MKSAVPSFNGNLKSKSPKALLVSIAVLGPTTLPHKTRPPADTILPLSSGSVGL